MSTVHCLCCLAWLLSVFFCTPLLADDIDIYRAPAGYDRGVSLVMLSLDLHPGLARVRCEDSASPACPTILGQRVYNALDLLRVSPDGTVSQGADGQPDWLQLAGSQERLTAWRDHAIAVSRLDEIRAALQVALRQPVLGRRRVAMMLSHDDSCPGAGPAMVPLPGTAGCSNGAYILSGFFRPLDDRGQVTPELLNFFARLAAIPLPSNATDGWQGHLYQLEERYLEYYRYITGGALYNARLGYTDYGSRNDLHNLGAAADDVDPLLAPDAGIFQSVQRSYLSPFVAGERLECSRLSMINLIAGDSPRDRESDAAWALTEVPGLSLPPDRDELLAALAAADILDGSPGPLVTGEQPLISHFVFFDENTPIPDWAGAGGGKILQLGSGANDLAESLTQLLVVPHAGGATLLSPAFARDIQHPGRSEAGVFFSLFLPGAGPRWPGNVKKYRLGDPVAATSNTGSADLPGVVDAHGRPAFAPEGGQISPAALSLWTDVAGADVSPLGCVDGRPPLAPDGVCGADGDAVTRGGAGQRIPGFLVSATGECALAGPGSNNQQACGRRLYTENPSVAGTLMNFDHDTTTAQLLRGYLLPSSSLGDGADLVEAMAIIGWARGLYQRGTSGLRLDGQRWMMGGVMHSRPLAVNYGDRGGAGGYSSLNPDIRLFFGANDGWLRSLRDTTPGGEPSGMEAWAFMPLEVMSAQQRLSLNSSTGVGGDHPYGVDGEPVALVVDVDLDGNVEVDDGDRVIVFFGLRRGGAAYYALDVTRPDARPELLWKITPQSAGFAALGLSFSTPTMLRVNFDGSPRQVLAFGGGYHGGWSADGLSRVGKDQSRSADPVGNAVYLVDPFSGELLWKAVGAAQTGSTALSQYTHTGMRHGIASQLAVLDTDGDGLHDRAYVGDTGGNVWRLELPAWDGETDARERWQVTRLASLASPEAQGDRRFFHPPDVVFARDMVNVAGEGEPPTYASRRYVGVVIASGNRAAPTGVEPRDFIYYLKDGLGDAGSSSVTPSSPLLHPQADVGGTGRVLPDISDCPRGVELHCQLQSQQARVSSLANGWALALGGPGEKGLSRPVTIDGTIYFTSYLPPASADQAGCEGGVGSGRLYAIRLADGRPAHRADASGGDAEASPRFIDLGVAAIAPYLPVILARRPASVPGAAGGFDEGEQMHLLLPDGNLFALPGRTRWKAYWREEGVDPD